MPKYSKLHRGLTLIELLVVIMILGLIMIMAIPRLRMINEDRSIREAARTVGSVFAKASQRAFTDGVAGVAIELNPNINDVDQVQYAGTALYMLQKVPPYLGEETGEVAVRINDFSLEINFPTSMNIGNLNDERNPVRPNDWISVNNSQIKYRINQIVYPTATPGKMRIDLFPDPVLPVLPAPPAAGGYPFVVHRQPRIQESSRVQLPEGYLIDMRFSGELRTGAPAFTPPAVSANHFPNRSVFHNQSTLPLARNNQTRILFGEDGSIERYQLPIANSILTPKGDLYFFIARFETSVDREQINSPAKTSAQPDPLNSPTNMWLIVDVQTGTSTISYNAPPAATITDLAARIATARSIAVTGQAAAD